MSSQTERDRSTDALLKAALSGLPAADASACVDAETLAAWSERALPSSDISRIEAHLAGCARCQAMLAAFVRTEPVAAAGVPFWQRWPAAKWLVPAATLAGTVVIVAVLTRETREAAIAPVQMAKQEAASGTVPLPTPEPPADVAMPPPATPPPARAESTPVAGRALKDAPLNRTAQAAVGNRDRADAEARGNELRQLTSPGEMIVAPASPPPPSTRVTDGAANVSVQESVKVEAGETKPTPLDANTSTKLDSVQVTNLPLNSYRNYQALVVLVPGNQPDASAQRTIAFDKVVAEIVSAPREPFAARASGGRGGRGGAGRGAAGAAQAAQAAAEATTLANTIPARWRILATGVVERSTNGGSTWHPVTVDTQVAVTTGGVSPSDLVCWLIGPGGVVMRSTDGLTLRRVKFPEMADLVSVTAVSDREATVMTADGRTFVTFDGGASWTRRP